MPDYYQSKAIVLHLWNSVLIKWTTAGSPLLAKNVHVTGWATLPGEQAKVDKSSVRFDGVGDILTSIPWADVPETTKVQSHLG